MSKLSKYSIISRSLIVVLLGVVLYVSVVNFLGTATSPTDENLFSDPPSRFYLAKQLDSYDSLGLEHNKYIQSGVLVLAIDGFKLKDTTDIKEIFKKIGEKEYVSIIVFEPYTEKKLKGYIKLEDIKNDALSFLSSAVLVIDVLKEGASDRAGMLAGDLIIKINGHHFNDMYHADRLLQRTTTGQATKYEVLRKNEIVTLSLIPVKFGLPIALILQHLAAFMFIAFGAFIALKRPKINAALILGLGLLLFGTVFTLSSVRLGLFSEVSTYNIIRVILLYFSLHFSIALLIQSTFYFPYKVSLAENKWLIWVLYGYAALAVSISIINMALIRYYGFNSIINIMVIAVILSFAIVRIIYRKEYSSEYKKANRLIFIAFSGLIITRLLLPYTRGISDSFMMNLNYLVLAFYFFLLWSYYYTIAKNRLLDLKIRIKRNIQYAFISVSWRIIAVGILVLILYCISQIEITFPNIHVEGTNLEVLNTPLNIEIQKLYEKVFLIVVSIVITIVWWKFKKYLQFKLDKKYHRTSFDYRKATSDLSKFLVRNFTLNDLTSNIAQELSELTHLKKIGIVIFKNEDTVVAQDFYGVKNKELNELIKSSSSKMAESTMEYRDDFRVEYLSAPLNDILRDFGFRFVQPIYSKSKLLGTLLIGEKLSEAPFNKDDFEFLHTISGQISVAIENSFLYEDLTQQERFKHELNIARRIQMASLPDTIPNVQGLEISGISLPALEVGGDFYDFLETENGEFMVIIGDVSGKGTSAALYMSKIQGIMRTLHQFRLSPRKLLVQTNHLLYQYLEKGYFISATSVNFDLHGKKVSVSRAGHLPLFLYKKSSEEVQRITNRGMVLGLTRDKTFERNLDETEIEFSQDDIFVLITDGVSEAKNNLMQEYSEERLVEIIHKNTHLTAEGLRDTIVNSVKDFAGSESQYDDMTVVVVKIK